MATCNAAPALEVQHKGAEQSPLSRDHEVAREALDALRQDIFQYGVINNYGSKSLQVERKVLDGMRDCLENAGFLYIAKDVDKYGRNSGHNRDGMVWVSTAVINCWIRMLTGRGSSLPSASFRAVPRPPRFNKHGIRIIGPNDSLGFDQDVRSR